MMRSRLLDAMGDALALVRKSNLAEATALLQTALSGGETRPRKADPQFVARGLAAPTHAPPARRPLGEVLRALRAKRPVPPAPDHEADGPSPHAFDEKFLRESIAASGARSTTGSMSRPITGERTSRWC